jgi:hypothetical protein
MTDTELRKVSRWVSEGGKLLLGRDHAGRLKLKVLHGPLGMFVHRFAITQTELDTLKDLLTLDSNSAAA